MTEHWIKIRKNLPTDPNVASIATACDISIAETVLALIKFWSWADSHSVDGKDITVTTAFIDDHCRVRNMSEALRTVNWLDVSDGTVSIPNFDVHLSQSAKRRAVDNKRKAKGRKDADEKPSEFCPKTVTVQSGQNSDQSKSKSMLLIQQQHITPDAQMGAAAANQNGGEGEAENPVSELDRIGVDPQVTSELEGDFSPARIRDVVLMVRTRTPQPTNPAGMVVSALRENWDIEQPQSSYEQEQQRQEAARNRKRNEDRRVEAARVEKSGHVRDVLGALPPDELEALKSAALSSMPRISKDSIPSDADPIEHSMWRSFMWIEFQKGRTAQGELERSAG